MSQQKESRQQLPSNMGGGKSSGSDGGKGGGWGARGSFSLNTNKDSLGVEGGVSTFGEEEVDIGGGQQRLKSAIGVQSELQRR